MYTCVEGGRLLARPVHVGQRAGWGWLDAPLAPIHRRLTLLQCISCMQIRAGCCAGQASNGVRGTVARLTNNGNVGGRVGVHAPVWCAFAWMCMCYGMVAVEWDGSHWENNKTATHSQR